MGPHRLPSLRKRPGARQVWAQRPSFPHPRPLVPSRPLTQLSDTLGSLRVTSTRVPPRKQSVFTKLTVTATGPRRDAAAAFHRTLPVDSAVLYRDRVKPRLQDCHSRGARCRQGRAEQQKIKDMLAAKAFPWLGVLSAPCLDHSEPRLPAQDQIPSPGTAAPASVLLSVTLVLSFPFRSVLCRGAASDPPGPVKQTREHADPTNHLGKRKVGWHAGTKMEPSGRRRCSWKTMATASGKRPRRTSGGGLDGSAVEGPGGRPQARLNPQDHRFTPGGTAQEPGKHRPPRANRENGEHRCFPSGAQSREAEPGAAPPPGTPPGSCCRRAWVWGPHGLCLVAWEHQRQPGASRLGASKT